MIHLVARCLVRVLLEVQQLILRTCGVLSSRGSSSLFWFEVAENSHQLENLIERQMQK